MQIIRGDDYQSWVYSNEDDLVVVDPWLTQKQVFPGLNWLLNRNSTTKAYLLKHNLLRLKEGAYILRHLLLFLLKFY